MDVSHWIKLPLRFYGTFLGFDTHAAFEITKNHWFQKKKDSELSARSSCSVQRCTRLWQQHSLSLFPNEWNEYHLMSFSFVAKKSRQFFGQFTDPSNSMKLSFCFSLQMKYFLFNETTTRCWHQRKLGNDIELKLEPSTRWLRNRRRKPKKPFQATS